MTTLFGQIMGIRASEQDRMSVLLRAAFFLGFSLTLFHTSSSAIFLSEYAADLLPQANILNALLVIALSVGYTASEKRLGFLRLLYTTVALLGVSAMAFWVLLAVVPIPLVKFLIMAWYRTLFIYGSIGLWETAARLFNIQEAKRLFAILSAAMMFATILGGLTAAPLVSLFGAAHHLLLASALGLLLYALHLMRELPRFRLYLEQHKTLEVVPMTLQDVLKNHYIVLFFALKITAVMTANVLEFVFYRQAAQMFVTEVRLASFLGIFVSTMTFFTLGLSALLSGRFVARFGLHVALPLHPSIIALGVLGALVVGMMTGMGSLFFFVVLALVRLSDGVLFGAMTSPVMAMLYQPLKASERAWVRVQSEGKLGSVALILSGCMLIVFQIFPAIPPLFYVVLLLGLAMLWLLVSRRTYVHYARLLTAAVRNVFLRQDMLANAVPTVVTSESLTAAGTLDANNVYLLRTLLEHPETQVKLSVLVVVEQEQLVELLPMVQALVYDREHPALLRIAALRTWCALTDAESALSLLNMALNDAALRVDALALLLARGQGAETLARLVRSQELQDRLDAAQVLCQVERYVDDVRVLLADDYVEVVRLAVRAAGQRVAELSDLLLLLLRREIYRTHVIAALSRADALPFVARQLAMTYDPHLQKALFEVLGNIASPESETLLHEYWQHENPAVRLWSLRALSRVPRQHTYAHDSVAAVVHREAIIAAEVLTVLLDAQPVPLVARALEEDLNTVRERLFHLYGLLYAREMIWGAYENWQRGMRTNNQELIGYALEGLFVLLGYEERRVIFALLERLSLEERLKRLDVSPRHRTVEQHYRTILAQGETGWASAWTKACVGYTLYQRGVIARDECFAFWPLEGEDAMFSVFEKVEILRGVSIFAQTPDAVLAEVAQLLQKQSFTSGAPILRENELGTRMYMLVSGRVHVHRHGVTLNYLEAPEIFGELSVLDAAPRVASVTAASDVTVFVLEREPLYQLMSTRPEIMEGVMRVLCQRVRQAVIA